MTNCQYPLHFSLVNFIKHLGTQLKPALNHIIIITITKILAERRCSDTTLVGEVTSEPPTALNTIILMGI